MHRHFGLGHLSPREVLPAQTRAGANAGALFFTWKAAAKRLYHGVCKAKASARAVHIECVYMGRVLLVHNQSNTSATEGKYPRCKGNYA